MTPIMFQSSFDDLRREKAMREKRDLSIRKVATETGLSLSTIQRIRIGDAGRVNLSTIETLMRYFDLSSIEDLIQYIPNELIEFLRQTPEDQRVSKELEKTDEA